MVANNKTFLDVNSFPPGSNRVFIDSVLNQGQKSDESFQLATDAKQIAIEQRTRNDAQDVILTNHTISINNITDRVGVLESDVDYLIDKAADLETRVSILETWRVYMTRQKAEAVWSGLSLPITTTATNFFTLLNTLPAPTGNLLPFFLLSAGRLKALNKNRDLKIKFTLEGTFGGAVLSRSLVFTFGTVVPDTIYINRNTALAADSMNLNTFFSVEEGDDITSPGITCMVQSVGGTFTVSRIKIIATQ